jgi:hypothetical protein
MVTEKELSLLLTARDKASATLKDVNSQLADMGVKVKQNSVHWVGLARPLAHLATGPLREIIRLGGVIGHVFKAAWGAALGPIAIIVASLAILEAKFNIIGKTIETVETVFKRMLSLNFKGMGKDLDDIWSGAKKATEEMMGLFDKIAELEEAQGNKAGAAFDREIIRHRNAMDEIKKQELDKGKKLTAERELEEKLHKQLLTNIVKEDKEANDKILKDEKENTDKKIAERKRAKEEQVKLQHEEVMGRIKQKLELDKENDKAREEAHKKLVERLKSDADIQEKSANEIAEINKKAAMEAQDAWERENAATIQFVQGAVGAVTSAISGSIESFLNDTKSFSESVKSIMKSFAKDIVATLAQVIAKMAVVAFLKSLIEPGASLEGSRAVPVITKMISSLGYQTHYGQERRVPGPPGMPVPIIAHGQEIIGRPTGTSGATVYNFNGPVFNPESLRRVLWEHSKRTGMPVQAMA